MRTQGYLVRSIGMTIGGLMGSILYNSDSWGWGLSISQCFLLQALLPVLTLFPCLPFMLELPYKGEVSHRVERARAGSGFLCRFIPLWPSAHLPSPS